jgi:hypothetical protein
MGVPIHGECNRAVTSKFLCVFGCNPCLNKFGDKPVTERVKVCNVPLAVTVNQEVTAHPLTPFLFINCVRNPDLPSHFYLVRRRRN